MCKRQNIYVIQYIPLTWRRSVQRCLGQHSARLNAVRDKAQHDSVLSGTAFSLTQEVPDSVQFDSTLFRTALSLTQSCTWDSAQLDSAP